METPGQHHGHVKKTKYLVSTLFDRFEIKDLFEDYYL